LRLIVSVHITKALHDDLGGAFLCSSLSGDIAEVVYAAVKATGTDWG